MLRDYGMSIRAVCFATSAWNNPGTARASSVKLGGNARIVPSRFASFLKICCDCSAASKLNATAKRNVVNKSRGLHEFNEREQDQPRLWRAQVAARWMFETKIDMKI